MAGGLPASNHKGCLVGTVPFISLLDKHGLLLAHALQDGSSGAIKVAGVTQFLRKHFRVVINLLCGGAAILGGGHKIATDIL